jgi:hypothetical protein
MPTNSDYDGSLTTRIQGELDRWGRPDPDSQKQLARLIARLEGDFRAFLADPGRRERTLAFLKDSSSKRDPPAPRGTAPPTGPIPRVLAEAAALSARLDQPADPSEGFSLAESVAQRAHEIAHSVEGFLDALDPADGLSDGFRRLGTLLSQLIRNAVERMREFARVLGVSSFSVTFGTAPPQISVTFNFAGP